MNMYTQTIFIKVYIQDLIEYTLDTLLRGA